MEKSYTKKEILDAIQTQEVDNWIIEFVKAVLESIDGKPLWKEAEKELPPYGKYVLARHNKGTWIDNGDPENVNCVVVKLVKSEVKNNNLKPYQWQPFGPGTFFGQEITHWTEIPAKNTSN